MLLLLAACAPGDKDAANADKAIAKNPTAGDMLPEEFRVIWEPWTGDLEGMVDRRVIRVVVPYGGYQFYYEDGQPKGAVHELLRHFERYINDELGRRNVRVYIVTVPLSRDHLIPSLLAGNADLVAGDLTVTEGRKALVDFSRAVRDEIHEVLVTGPSAPEITGFDDLAGENIFVRPSSSYYEHLQQRLADFTERGLEPPNVVDADELLEAEDILEMVNSGFVGMTIMDQYKAEFWSQVFPDIVVRDDIVFNENGEIAWAMRKDSPEFMALVNAFLRKHGRGTLIGNDTYNRYLESSAGVRCSATGNTSDRIAELAPIFRKYGDQYDFDWLMLVAQGQQESGLRQNRRSPAGAVGIMQIKPSTAADPNVGIADVSTADANIHAAARYMRFLSDRYFSDDDDKLNRWLFSLAAYNAGPAKIARYRREAAEQGYDPDRWFDNVEIIAARRIGRETVQYVSNVFKYYIGYQLTLERARLYADRFGDILEECFAD
ncbi:MAG: transporter substrate-binding domain-containing protein [Woeseiaceae bacterium]|nr:transporter substrate-binding domain-containing protein [Woeseiaceae bacterium]